MGLMGRGRRWVSGKDGWVSELVGGGMKRMRRNKTGEMHG